MDFPGNFITDVNFNNRPPLDYWQHCLASVPKTYLPRANKTGAVHLGPSSEQTHCLHLLEIAMKKFTNFSCYYKRVQFHFFTKQHDCCFMLSFTLEVELAASVGTHTFKVKLLDFNHHNQSTALNVWSSSYNLALIRRFSMQSSRIY